MLSEVDEDGNVTHANTKYDVYGAVDPNDEYGQTDSKHRFCGSLGHTQEDTTGGLIYMRARWYDPATGRFVSEDPAGDGTNRYVYTDNNPVNAVDPDGQWDQALISAGWAIISQSFGELRLAFNEARRFYTNTMKALATDAGTPHGLLLKTEFAADAASCGIWAMKHAAAAVQMIAVGSQLIYLGLLE